MTRSRAITTTGTLLALALSAGATPAGANPLLSGYGGPGQGSQVILGSTLLNGPAGPGGGSAGSSAAASSASAAEAALASGSAGGGGAAAVGAGATVSGQTSHPGGHAGGASPTSRSGSPTPTPTSAPSKGTVSDAQTLGLAGADVLYILLAAGALLATGAITRQLARGAREQSDVR